MAHLKQDEKAWAFDTIFTNSPIGMAILQPDGTFYAINAAWCSLLESTPAEWLGKKYQELTTSETIRLDEQNAKLVLDGSMDTYTLSKAYHLKGGSIIKNVRLTVGRVPPSDYGPMLFYVAQIIRDDELIIMPAVTKIQSLPSLSKGFMEMKRSFVDNATWISIVIAIIGGTILYIIEHLKK